MSLLTLHTCSSGKYRREVPDAEQVTAPEISAERRSAYCDNCRPLCFGAERRSAEQVEAAELFHLSSRILTLLQWKSDLNTSVGSRPNGPIKQACAEHKQ